MPVSYANGWFAVICEFLRAQSSITIHQSVWQRGTNHLTLLELTPTGINTQPIFPGATERKGRSSSVVRRTHRES